MISDIYKGGEPKKKYLYNTINCPEIFRDILESYQLLMKDDRKSEGTIRSRISRIKILFFYLDDHACSSFEGFSGELLVDFIGSLNDRYCSQAKASILYTIRNFFSYEVFAKQVSFNPMIYLMQIHSKKHERLLSFYTIDEVRRVLNAVDRDTLWGKTIYLMMLLAYSYGMRTSDIKQLKLSNIHWSNKLITISQYKTKQQVTFPLTNEVTYALLDYIKNVRHDTQYSEVFIRKEFNKSCFERNFIEQWINWLKEKRNCSLDTCSETAGSQTTKKPS